MDHQYVTAEEIISDFLPEADPDDATVTDVLDRLAKAASNMVDSITQRPDAYFEPAADGATDRYFTGTGARYIQLPIHVAGSVVVTEPAGAVLASSNYYEHPKNGWIYLTDNASFGTFYDGQRGPFWPAGQRFKITARWGYESTPQAIKTATAEIVALWYGKGRGVVGDISPSGFVIEREIPLTARAALRGFTRREFEIV